jgi:hypothetical protein
MVKSLMTAWLSTDPSMQAVSCSTKVRSARGHAD